jgi:hypothetical protein
VACVQPLNQVEDAAGGGLVQVAGGFVGQQQPGIVDQRAGQRHALLLAAGKFAGPMVAAISRPTSLSQFAATASASVCCAAASSGMATFSSAVNSGSK